MNDSDNQKDIVREIGFSLLSEGKTIKVRADGYSMYPAIKPGTVILIEPVAPDRPLQPGEVIAWKRETGLIVHRLVRIYRNNDVVFYFTRGDSCRYEDKPVTPGSIAGRVTGTYDKTGNELKTLRLKKNHCYLYNRSAIWIILKFKKLMSLAGSGKL